MKRKFRQTAFHTLRLNQLSKFGGYEVDPSFTFNLWISLEQWFNMIARIKKSKNQKPILRFYDVRVYSTELVEIMKNLKGGKS